MSTASAAGRPEGKRWGAWGAHHEIALVWIMIAVGILFEINTLILNSGHSPFAFPLVLAEVVIYDLMIITMLKARGHLSRICVECIAQMPLNGQELAIKKRERLRLFHIMLINSKSGIIINIGVILLMTGTFFLSEFVFNLIFFTYIVGNMYLNAVHRPLLPFCPWCRGGGGGPHEHVPNPDPSMIKIA